MVIVQQNQMVFELTDIPDLTGYNAIVTGGNTGIGYEVVKQLVIKNCSVTMASRSKSRAQDAIEKIKEETGKSVEFLELDLQDLKQVKAAAEAWVAEKRPLDILINNAGIMACPFALSKDGYETQFATNHLGHFQFTTFLLPSLLSSSKSPRIVNLSSIANKVSHSEGVDFGNINTKSKYSTVQRYGQSKLANILFTHSLHKRYGDKIIVNAVHPGVVNTELQRGLMQFPILGTLVSIFKPLYSPLLLTPIKGAMSTLYAATSPEIIAKEIKDKYILPVDILSDDVHPMANNLDLAEKLWNFSEGVVKDAMNR